MRPCPSRFRANHPGLVPNPPSPCVAFPTSDVVVTALRASRSLGGSSCGASPAQGHAKGPKRHLRVQGRLPHCHVPQYRFPTVGGPTLQTVSPAKRKPPFRALLRGIGTGRGANYRAPLTRKRHIPPHPAQPRRTNHWAPRTRKRHQQEHRPQRPTERSDPTQHAKGRTDDCPGLRIRNNNPTECHTGGVTGIQFVVVLQTSLGLRVMWFLRLKTCAVAAEFILLLHAPAKPVRAPGSTNWHTYWDFAPPPPITPE